MLLSKLPDQKQDPSTEVPQPQSSSAESSPPQEWPSVGVSLLFLHDAVDHVRIGFEPAGQTEGSQNRIDHHPKPKTAYCDCICQLLSVQRLPCLLSAGAGGALSQTSFHWWVGDRARVGDALPLNITLSDQDP
jgi:hypothetical protein